MKSYLDLVPISEKIHQRQSRMAVFCIVLAVFLVTTIFGMADMFIRSQVLQTQEEYGNWHIGIKQMDETDAKVLEVRPDVATVSSYGVSNYRLDEGYQLAGKDVVICGSNAAHIHDIFAGTLIEGHFPQAKNEALVSENAREILGLKIGDSISVSTAEKTVFHFTVSGFLKNTSGILRHDAYGIFLKMDDYDAICADTPEDIMHYVQFADTRQIQKTIAQVKEQFELTEAQVSENTKLVGLLGQSTDSFMMRIYQAALVLFVLVLLSGVFMIASSLNSNVAQRTEFFGLIRCIGATQKQVMRLVYQEALGWCRFAIPLGVGCGIVVIWILCALLRYLSPAYFGAMPVFQVSIPSILAGIVVGLLTVLLAARAPARRAAVVSPLAAVSGHANLVQPVRTAANTRFFRVEIALGIHHAMASRKNLILMTGSFALSMILFLAFSTTIDFMKHSLTPLRPWTADISIISPDHTRAIDAAFLDKLEKNPAVSSVYGRMFAYDMPISVHGEEKRIDLISYEQRQFDWAKAYLLEGALETAQTQVGTGCIVYESGNTIQVGDTITIDWNGQGKEIKIVGMLSACPFQNAPDVGTVICSEETFQQITGQVRYTILDMQLNKEATDADILAIRQMAGDIFRVSDARMENQNVRGTYYSMGLFVYGFLILIAMITIFHVINSIARSVSARTKQYGAFRAIGLSSRQLSHMIVAEVCTYTVLGSVFGVVLGLICNKSLFTMLVSSHWGDPWQIPWTELGIILLVMLAVVIFAVYAPIQRLKQMSIVDTISAE